MEKYSCFLISRILKHSGSEQFFMHPGDIIKPCKLVAQFENDSKFLNADIIDEYHLVFPRDDLKEHSSLEVIVRDNTFRRLDLKLSMLYPQLEKIPHYAPRPLPLKNPLLYSIKINRRILEQSRSFIQPVQKNSVIWYECETFDPVVHKRGWRTSSNWNREYLHTGFSGKGFLLTHGKKWIEQPVELPEKGRYMVWVRYWADGVKFKFNIGDKLVEHIFQDSQESNWQWAELDSLFLKKGTTRLQVHPIKGVILLDTIVFIRDDLYIPEDLILSTDGSSIYTYVSQVQMK
jgi:hypothetical protein